MEKKTFELTDKEYELVMETISYANQELQGLPFSLVSTIACSEIAAVRGKLADLNDTFERQHYAHLEAAQKANR